MPQITLTRRAAVLGSFALAPLLRPFPAYGNAGEDRIGFEILRHGSVIGSHQVVFERSGGMVRAHIDCTMHVGFGPLVFFRYRHQGVEVWQDGVFQSLDTSTDNNGHPLRVTARRTAHGIDIRTADGTARLAPAGALPLTHWNVACMRAPLFNPQDGTLIHETATCAGPDTVALADGRRVAATRYDLKGAAPIDDWYDAGGAWTALRAEVKDGSVLQYRRV
jgi:hypothetical protein